MTDREELLRLDDGRQLRVRRYDALVVGSGAAGFNAANQLRKLGVERLALITEGRSFGTSRNTGSDKQTYYKLSLAGDDADSVRALAQDLFAGGAVHGDAALVEAAGSVPAFIRLAELGVPFPVNEAGEYVGYRTDHDPRSRATSAGPLTSRFMTECLERESAQLGVEILDRMTAVELVVLRGRIAGLLAIDQDAVNGPTYGLTLFACEQIILATGGPAGVYRDSVYPHSQTGMSGMALSAGARGNNLDQWQYGLASCRFRWNVSGTYMQVLPRFFSVDEEGVEHDFLSDAFERPEDMLDRVFLKGYQWPFDSRRVRESSRIDLLVLAETLAGRRVYLDYRRNPTGLAPDYTGLSAETRDYLLRSGATQATPLERLMHMNPDAVALYRAHAIDLETEPLEIILAAQHHNGGLAVDRDGRCSLPGLYAAGEVAGTFGLYRPGGSALNATQVTSARAAQAVALALSAEGRAPLEAEALAEALGTQAQALLDGLDQVVARGFAPAHDAYVHRQRQQLAGQMSAVAAALRDPHGMAALDRALASALGSFFERAQVARASQMVGLLINRDLMVTMRALLDAMQVAAQRCGDRGAALVLCAAEQPGAQPLPGSPPRFHSGSLELAADECLETAYGEDGRFHSTWVPVRPMPEPELWFENAWRADRARRAAIRSLQPEAQDGEED